MKTILAAMAAVLTLCSVVLAGDQDFTLVNETGVEIHEIFISAASVDNWEEDLLGEDEVLADGYELEISFDADEEAELWDIKVTDDEGSAVVWQRLKLTEISRVTLKMKKGKPVAELE